MSHQRRRPDSWANIRVGDIISFDTTSPRCPASAFVRGVTVREDGRYVLTDTGGKPIVEHKTYRMRLDQRMLATRMRANNGPLAWADFDELDTLGAWTVTQTFDWAGKKPPVFRIDTTRPVELDLTARWNVRRLADLTDSTDLIVEGWCERQAGDDGDHRGWRRFNPATRELEPIDGHDVVCAITPGQEPQNPAVFAELDSDERAVARLNDVLGWIYDNRYELDDPAVARKAAS